MHRQEGKGGTERKLGDLLPDFPVFPVAELAYGKLTPLPPLPSPLTRISPAPAGIGLATLLRRHTRTARHAIVTGQIVKSVIEDRRPPAQRSGGTDLASESLDESEAVD